MIRRVFFSRSGKDLAVCILILAAVNLACMGFKKPWRDYSAKPFSSAEWLAGDKIERGRMLRDVFLKYHLGIGSRDETVNLLGEADFKKNIEKKEVWFYRIDLGIPDAMDVVPVSFDEKGRGVMGMTQGGTGSMAAKESEL